MKDLLISPRITKLKDKMLAKRRFASIEQALMITEAYKKNEAQPIILKRALALKEALLRLEIGIEPEELIVGNRTKGVRYGVVFPESGSSWIDREFETLPTRPQDKFQVHAADIETFRAEIKPYWQGHSLEDVIRSRFGSEIDAISKVVKINQKDHAQGHICPDCKGWLQRGPSGIKALAEEKMQTAMGEKREFYQSIVLVMEGVQAFMLRYHDLLLQEAAGQGDPSLTENMREVARICKKLAGQPPESFHEAVQSIWFLFVTLHMESNASSFSPGRMDQYLYRFYQTDLTAGKLDEKNALEIIECFWLKCNEIVYLRNAHSAKYFAGFPIGFNIAIGGLDACGNAAENELSYLFLKAQEHLGLPQPNLSVRLNKNTSDNLLKESIKVVAKGSGMPQFFNDEAVVRALPELGISNKDALDYAIVGCVELTTQGNNLGWSDAAMFNLNKALELTLNHGRCLLTGEQIAPDLGSLAEYETYEALEAAFAGQIDYFIEKMIAACAVVEQAHIDVLPSPFLSSVINDCLETGKDVTAGGAHYNLSGIQMIQVANLADSLAALKKLVYEEKRIGREALLSALQNDFAGQEVLRVMLHNKVDKYGNDVPWVDAIGAKWARYFKEKLTAYTNHRGGRYHTGMYTVSAHVPMGENVGASSDGRRAKQPLADGGLSPVYGRDTQGPTAVLQSVARLGNDLTTNGGLLNMKFLPEFFAASRGIDQFSSFLRTFVDLEIPHIQFNVLRREDLLAAQQNPELYRSLTVRVAGYTAYFTELAGELQQEIIARTSYGAL